MSFPNAVYNASCGTARLASLLEIDEQKMIVKHCSNDFSLVGDYAFASSTSSDFTGTGTETGALVDPSYQPAVVTSLISLWIPLSLPFPGRLHTPPFVTLSKVSYLCNGYQCI